MDHRVEQCLFVGQTFHCLLLKAEYRKQARVYSCPVTCMEGWLILPTAFQRFFSSLRTHSLLRTSLCPVRKWPNGPWSGARLVAESWRQKCWVFHPAGIGVVSYMVDIADGGFVKWFWRSLWFEARWPSVIECSSMESVNPHPSGLYQCALRMKKPQTRLLICFLVYALTSRRGIFFF